MVVTGETDVDPELAGVTKPTPLSILKRIAFVVVQESVEDEPVWMDVGLAVSVQTSAGGGAGGYVQVTPVWLVAAGL